MAHTPADNPTNGLPFAFPLYSKTGEADVGTINGDASYSSPNGSFSSKQSYKKALKKEIKNSKSTYDNIKAITHTATKSAQRAQINRISRRIQVARYAEKMPIACALTGIVSMLDIPAIPQNFVEWDSPFQSIEVCRAIAKRGVSYLRSLDTQVLAGILITMTAKYDLIHTGTPMHGVEINAILRTAGKDTLVKTILLIEEYVHSKNLVYLPRLSLAWDTGIDNGIEGRLINWLKLIVEYIVRPAPIEDAYAKYKTEEFKAAKKIMRPVTIVMAKATAMAVFKTDMKKAKILLATIPASTISAKIRAILMATIENKKNFLSMDPSVLSLIADKLELLDTVECIELSSILRKDRSQIQNNEINEFDSPISSSSAFVVPSSYKPPMEENTIAQVEAPAPKTLKEIIAARKAMKPSVPILSTPVFSEPILILPASTYTPVSSKPVLNAHFREVESRMMAEVVFGIIAITPVSFLYGLDSLRSIPEDYQAFVPSFFDKE